MSLACGCPDSFPEWDNRDIDLGAHPSHILPMPTLFHMPLSYGLYVQRQRAEIEELELVESWPRVVFSETGFLGGRIIALLESALSPSRHVQCLPAEFQVRAKLHHGGIGTVRNTIRQLQSELLDNGRMPKQLLMSHLTCDLCRSKRGGDKILVIRRFETSKRLRARSSR